MLPHYSNKCCLQSDWTLSVNCRLGFGAGGCSSLLAKFMSTFGVVGPWPDEGGLIEKVARRLRFDRWPVDSGGEIGG